MRILVNHVGYELAGPKRAIVQDRGSAGAATAARPPARPPAGSPARPPAGADSERSSPADERGVEPQKLRFRLREELSGRGVLAGNCSYLGPVDRWRQGVFWSLDFSAFREPGSYRIELLGEKDDTPVAISEGFEIRRDLIFQELFSGLLFWFKGQRSSGAEDMADRAASFYGDRSGTVDLRGGWFDASGDSSKYLSHLSYADYLNPQQSPGVVWTMLAARDLLAGADVADTDPTVSSPEAPALWERRLLDEIAWGADFLVRMQDPEGYFYMTLFDQWSHDPDQRIVSSFRTQDGHRGSDYQAGYRQGGGMAIAALARAGFLALRPAGRRQTTPSETVLPGEFPPERYLEAARRGFDHLEEHNLAYLNDGRENIIDDYCALLAATELYLAEAQVSGSKGGGKTAEALKYLEAARRRAASLSARLIRGDDGLHYWRGGEAPAEGATERPYYHAAEAGLPTLALMRYAEAEDRAAAGSPGREGSPEKDDAPGRAAQARDTARTAMEGELAVTAEVTNPFGYARQHVAEPDGRNRRTAFFVPHKNESEYWWQGENARLASLSAAASLLAVRDSGDPSSVGAENLRGYAQDQINWILGLNPFDVSMVHGKGRNNAEYEVAYPNTPGGVCNGITGGVEDEGDVAFLPEPWGDDPLHRWRWSEQWIPHAGWLLLAVAARRRAEPS